MPEWPELTALQDRFPEMLHVTALDVCSIKSAQGRRLGGIFKRADHLDLLINNAGVIAPSMYGSIGEPQDYGEMHRLYDVNSLGPLAPRGRRILAAHGLHQGLKRMCFVSSEAGSIGRFYRTAGRGSAIDMSKTALNMAVSYLVQRSAPGRFHLPAHTTPGGCARI